MARGEKSGRRQNRHLSNFVNSFLCRRIKFSHKNPQLFHKVAVVTVRTELSGEPRLGQCRQILVLVISSPESPVRERGRSGKRVLGTSVQLRVVGKLPLRCWGLNDLESQMGGSPLEVVNLPLAGCGLIDLRSLIHKLHPETQHAIDLSGELCCHRLDRDRCFQPASQSAKLCPQIGFAFSQAVSGHAEGHAQPVVRWQSVFANHPITAAGEH